MSARIHDFLVGKLDREGSETLQRQIYRIIQDSILQGRLPVDFKMPSTRSLADQLQISRITVSLAYERLTEEGYLYSRPGSGTYVADTLPQTYLPAKKVEEAEYTAALLSRRGLAITSRVTGLAKAGGAFVPGVADADLFPFHIWKRLQNRYFRKNHMELTGYVEHGGYRRLREALASYLYASRAVKCRSEQIIITMGTHQSLDLVAKLLSDPGDSALIETPCHWGAPVVFSAAGLAAQPIAIDSDGACLPELANDANPRFAFITPSHQYPTGNIMSLQRRREWLAFSDARNIWILEDDYDSEFRYDTEPLPSLQGLDTKHRVIYLGTFSKVAFPGLRLSYLVVPEPLADAFSKGMTQLYRPGLLPVQAAMADFIQEGHFASHIRKMRTVYAGRRSLLQKSLLQQFGSKIQFSEGSAGIHLAVTVTPKGIAREMIRRAPEFGLTLRGSYQLDATVDDDLLVLGYGGIKEPDIAPAVQRLRQLYDSITAA
jgi:GntR family transcriptional regulator/MocR family aminotransferase